MRQERTRIYSNRSYLRLVDLYHADRGQWSDDDRKFVDEMEQLVSEFSRTVYERCRELQLDALLYAFERCRHDSRELVAKCSLAAGSVICPDWLAEPLQALVSKEETDRLPAESDAQPESRLSLDGLGEALASQVLDLDISLTRGVVLTAEQSDRVRDYLVRKWFEGTPGLRGRHSQTDRKITDVFKHYHRYSIVENLRAEGQSLTDARLNALDHVQAGADLGSGDAYERSHKMISKRFKEDPDSPILAMLLASVLVANDKAGLW